MTRACGSNETVNGHGCMNLVSDVGDHCSAGHQCVPPGLNAKSHKPNNGETSSFSVAALTDMVGEFEIEELVAAFPYSQPQIWMEWHQKREAKFDTAEFYYLGSVASVHCGDEIIEIENEGDRKWKWESRTGLFGGMSIQNPKEFREQFPDGKLPADGENGWTVVNNGWFTLYQPGFDDPATDEPFFSLEEAVEYAKNVLEAYSETWVSM